MFTGIITNTATIAKWKSSKSGGRLFIKPRRAYKNVRIGESIAINGCCLTIVSTRNKELAFDISDETVRKTAFIRYKKGSEVNLERAMKASDSLGGHFVLGHVDGVGKVLKVQVNPGSVEYVISYPKKFAHLLIEKGSVAVDGISLTVCDLTKTTFGLYIIPHTLKETNMPTYKKGDLVNLEFDVLGKYIWQQSRGRDNQNNQN